MIKYYIFQMEDFIKILITENNTRLIHFVFDNYKKIKHIWFKPTYIYDLVDYDFYGKISVKSLREYKYLMIKALFEE